jgi:type I restriction-modification system DNA methylase subunit
MNVFWVPKEARWSHIQANAKQPTIGKLIDEAMLAIEKENLRLKGVLPMQYARPDLDKQRLGELIDLISTLGLGIPLAARRIFWGGCMSISWGSLPRRKVRAVESFIRRSRW